MFIEIICVVWCRNIRESGLGWVGCFVFFWGEICVCLIRIERKIVLGVCGYNEWIVNWRGVWLIN